MNDGPGHLVVQPAHHRAALDLGGPVVDRQQMLDLVFGGFGTVGNDVFGIWAPDYDHSLPQRHQDIDQAKSLLRAAGAEDLQVSLITSDIGQGVTLAAQVLAQQASLAGITMSVDDVTVNDFYGTNYLKWTYVGAGVTTRTWTVNMPTTAGTYEFRLFPNNGYTTAATSPPVTVTP